MTTSANIRLDEPLWIAMINKITKEQAKYLSEVDFWVELKEMTDKQGNTYYQEFPRFAATFK